MTKHRTLTLASALLLSVGLSASALAQQVPWNGMLVDAEYAAANPTTDEGTKPVGETPAVYGTSGWGGYGAGPCDAFVRTGGAVENLNCNEILAATDTSALVGFPIHLPSGAVMQYMRVYYYGNNASLSISGGLYKTSSSGGNTLIAAGSPAGTAAGATMEEFGPFNEVVNNAPGSGNTYVYLAILPRSGTSLTKIYRVYVYYTLQVSPAPASATFSDVPVGAFAFQHIEAMAASGITSGCGGGMFCPNNNVTRAEMAVFFAKALGLHYQY